MGAVGNDKLARRKLLHEVELEGRRLLEALGPQDVPLVLDERGITMTSPQLAQLLQKIEELGIPMILEKTKSDTPMCANVDMYSGLVYTMLDIPEDVFTPLFASARIAGWCANRIEEVVTCHRIMRPAYRAVTTHEAYIPMDQRGEHLHLSAAD